MGRIVRLEVSNFKSYRGHQIIGPFTKFQAIIGPNGAGKSNLMDAISFVLGVKTPQLRGTNLKDLINVGAPSDDCYVKLVYTDQDWNQTNPKSLEFLRGIKSNGASEYKLNGKLVTAKDYDKKLQDLGIIVKAKNFLVFQGDVESIAAKSPKDLTELIEQISGSIELREEYESLQSEKERAEENTIYNYQKKKGANAEKKQLKLQKDEADLFHKKRQELAEKRQKYILWQLFHIEKEAKVHVKDTAAKQAQLEEMKGKQSLVEKELKRVKQEQAKVHKESLLLEKKIRKQAETEGKTEEIKIKEEIQFITKRRTASTTSLAKLNAEYEKQQKTIDSLREQIKVLEKASKDLDKEFEKLKKVKEVTLERDQIEEYNARKEQAFRETADKQQLLLQYNRLHKQDEEALNNVNARIQEMQDRRKQIEETIDKLKERKAKIQELNSENEAKMQKLRERQQELSSQNTLDRKRQAELTSQLERIQEDLQDAKADKKQNERETRFTEALESLKRLFPGVHGRLIDICSTTNNKYNVAVTVAMGSNMEAVIVDDEKTAMECIQYLKEQRVGTATFIPLDKIKVKPIPEKLRLLGGTAKPIIDVLKFHEKFQKGVLYAVGSTIFCETIAEARRLSFDSSERHKVVTEDGTLIQKSGLMTGGLSGIEARAQRWNAKEIAELKRNRDRLLKELADIARSLRNVELEHQLNFQISSLETVLKYSKVDLDMTDKKIKDYTSEIMSIDDKIKQLVPEQQKLKSTTDDRQEALDSLKAEINQIEDAIFKDFCRAVGVSNIREYEDTQLKQAKELAERRVQIATQLSKLQNQLDYEQKRDIAGPRERLDKTVKEDTEKLEQLRRRESEVKAVSMKEQEETSKLTKKLQDFKSIIEEKETEIKEFKKQMSTLVNEAGTLQKQITAEEAQIERLKKRRHDLLQSCRVEEIQLPKKSAEGEEDAMEVEADDQDEAILRAVDFSSVRKEVKTQKDYDVINDAFLQEIQNISAELDKINPNLKAIEKLGTVAARLDVLNKDFDDAKNQAQNIGTRFAQVKQERYRLFMAAFEKIAENIDKLYKELTNIQASTASLQLENADEPYLEGIKYNAIPPNKRFRDMEQLSGGEKTIAALALLFAIHSVQPAPFFVLDEVDAALDPMNVSKVVNFIKNKSSTVQCLVISLKNSFFEKADALIGIYKDREDGQSSKTLTLDLTKYDL